MGYKIMDFGTIISTARLADHLGAAEFVLFDCRFSLTDGEAGERAYGANHIPGAHYINLERDLSSPVSASSGRHPLPDPTQLARKLAVKGVNNDVQVVAYDDSGGAFAARLWWLLRWLGHTQVAVLDGGMGKWAREGRPLTRDIPVTAAKSFQTHVKQNLWLTTEQIKDRLEANAILLMDARAAPRFYGKEEPIDTVAGHVPGAVNKPFQENLTQDGCFLGPERLRDQFDEALRGFSSTEVVHMCGSGVTACHNVLAMEIAGLRGSRLYAGSWSEWIRDSARPVALGRD